MDVQTQELCDTAVRQVARYYTRKCLWIGFDDLVQEGWAVAAQVLTQNNLDRTRLGAYVRTAVSRNLSRYCWAQSCIVSAHRPGKQLAGLLQRRIAMGDAMDEAIGESPNDLEAHAIAMQAAVLVPRLRRDLRERLAQIYAFAEPGKETPNPCLLSCLEILVDGRKPKEAAEAHEVALRSVYNTTCWLKRDATKDRRVRGILGRIAEQRENLHEYQWTN